MSTDQSTGRILDSLQVAEELRELFAQYPNNVNPTDENGSCRYFKMDDDDSDSADHCAIGMYAIAKGWELSEDDETVGAAKVAERHCWPVTEGARDLLSRAQTVADDGWSWGEIFFRIDLDRYADVW